MHARTDGQTEMKLGHIASTLCEQLVDPNKLDGIEQARWDGTNNFKTYPVYGESASIPPFTPIMEIKLMF